MINLEITSFAKILCKGLKQYLKNENIKINDVDFQELENKLINEFNLPYSDQTQTPTQLLNNFTKKIYKFEKVITCLLYTSPSPRDRTRSRMPSSA